MGLSVVTYALCKKYTDETAIQFGGLKGAPCKVKSVQKENGQSVITLEQKNDSGETRESEVFVNDGVTMQVSGRTYAVGDLVIYDETLYYCNTANSDSDFTPSKWTSISGSSAESDYYIIDVLSGLPNNLTSVDRKIYFVLEDSNFHLQNGTTQSIISSSVKIRELTQAQYNALTPAEKLNGTIYFVTDAGGGGGGGDASLENSMTATKAVGGVSVGKFWDVGTALEQVLRDVLAPVLYPSFTNPSASISATGAKLLEKGGTLNTTVTVTFNRGTISPAYGTSGKRSGAATGYSLNGGTTQSGNTFAITVSEAANYSLVATVDYEAGEQPKDSAGQNYSTPLPAGSVNSNAINYEFVNALWANTTSAATIEKQGLVSKSAKVEAFSFPATTATDPECFDVPADYTVTAVEVLNTLSNQWENASGQFSISNVNHDDAGGTSTAYRRYSCNLGISLGARQVRVKWS